MAGTVDVRAICGWIRVRGRFGDVTHSFSVTGRPAGGIG
jgi:hypothetical protein